MPTERAILIETGRLPNLLPISIMKSASMMGLSSFNPPTFTLYGE